MSGWWGSESARFGDDDHVDQLRDIEAKAYERLDPLTRHHCPDWDGMAIDKTCPEYECCTCVKSDAPTR